MFSSIQLFSILSLTLVILSMHFINGVPINFDSSDDINAVIGDQTKLIDDEPILSKRKLPVEGILIGRREFSNDDILLDKRNYPIEGILLGKRNYPAQGVPLREHNIRFFAPKPIRYN
ncbi:unnamed protein product [Rotaria sordida]|uniref:Uncharacterized protein n=1 Tax=Rotaria sordida TaxID=392033 RepID=A0A814PPY3_9BILA|nr:unnamed protein product [Rotaria sordida]CAF4006209.1 unnamed protein product [Rotaria sordida]